MELDALIEQLRLGEPSAGPILVSIVAPRLLGYAAAIARDLSEADHEEVVEAAIEKAVLKIERYEPDRGSFVGWVRTFVRNEVATWRRNHPAPTAPVTDQTTEINDRASDDPTDGPSPQETAITALVLELPEPAQLLLRLRFAEGLDHVAIAGQLDVRPDAARKRLQRILHTIRNQAAQDPDLKHLGGDS